jgi:outer membrane protein assembly factor BamB
VLVVAFAAGVGSDASASAQGSIGWTSFQGGPEHQGISSDGPPPALAVAWRKAGDGQTASASPSSIVVDGGLAIAVSTNQVVALDVTTGDQRWRLGRAPGYLVPAAVDPSSGILVFTQGRGGSATLVAVRMADRSEMWRFPVGSALSRPLRGAPVIADGTVFVGGDDGSVYAIDLTSGARRWTYRAGGMVQTSPAAAGGSVYAVAEDGSSGRATLVAIDASTGKRRWSYSPSGVALHVSAPTVADGRVFVGFGDGTVRAFDAATGRVLWTARVRGLFSAMNAIAAEGGAVYPIDATGALYRFDAATGERAWDFQFTTTCVRSAPLVARGYAYVGLDDGSVAAVDVASGKQVWIADTGTGAVGGMAAADGTLLVPSVGTSGNGGSIVAFRHTNAPLQIVDSPTTLHLGSAFSNFGIAFVIVLGGLLLVFGVLVRRRDRTPGVGLAAPDAGSGADA